MNKILNKNYLIPKRIVRIEYPNRRSGRKHLNWKERRRERALRYKALRTGLSERERIELEDLNFVKVIAEGEIIR